ncbi:hypothetical protein HD806DRAFT_501649 [Xylariaceae sp. AK1471]|nr:hypothetical protein HD806DRAFT_501649 [Xylariaceae sp. AK1471]
MSEEAEGLLSSVEKSTASAEKHRRIYRVILAASVSLNVFLVLFGVSAWTRHRPSYENGFALDLEPVKSEIRLIENTYSGGVNLNADGKFIADEGGHEFVGPPSDKVDLAWERLMSGLNINLSHDEVDLSASTFQWPESGLYFSGLEVYHSLHCLNRLRQALYPERYSYIFDDPNDPSRLDHIGHCINHIRQALQCHADLTPMEWKLDGSKIILKTDTRHTCRDWDKIHGWASSRQIDFDSIESLRNGSLVIVD